MYNIIITLGSIPTSSLHGHLSTDICQVYFTGHLCLNTSFWLDFIWYDFLRYLYYMMFYDMKWCWIIWYDGIHSFIVIVQSYFKVLNQYTKYNARFPRSNCRPWALVANCNIKTSTFASVRFWHKFCSWHLHQTSNQKPIKSFECIKLFLVSL